jgi:predicted TIM-barrel fold metal-dependent hydrolase
MQRKIAVEEHYALPPVKAAGNNAFREDYLADVQRRLSHREARIEEMDANGIEYTPVSLTEPGIQGIPNPREAVDMAKRCNDHVYEYYMQAYPKRFGGLASVALQNPKAAGAELERSVKQMGFVGCMINGFTDMADSSKPLYLDSEFCLPFWEMVAELDIPVFLHPRVPHFSQRLVLEGYEGIWGSAWGFGRETAEHAVRMVLSGLFDRFPKVNIVLGHVGEALTFTLPRMDHRLRYQSNTGHGRHEKPAAAYLRSNFYLSTSGNARTPQLRNVMAEIDVERILFAVDMPFEKASEISGWFDNCEISELDRQKIGRANALRLFKLEL